MKSRLTKLLVAMCVGVAALVLANPAGAVASADQIAAGPYHMAFRHSGKCVAIPNNTTTNVQLHQWSCFDTASELWYFDYIFTDANGFDFYRIRSAHSGKCLNVSGNSTADGAAVIQYPCGNFANEYFTYWADSQVPAGYGWLQAYSSGKVLNIGGASTANGGKLIQYTRCHCDNEYVHLS